MLLSGPQIADEVKKGTIVIDPYNPDRINPNSYDLCLDKGLAVYATLYPSNEFPWAPAGVGDKTWTGEPYKPYGYLDMKREEELITKEIPDTGLILYPGVLYLGSTVERTFTDKYAPKIDGKSSVGRLGMGVHVTAGFGDVGFDGRWTLEITVVHPLKVYPGVPICQVAFSDVKGDLAPYRGLYQHQTGIAKSRYFQRFRDPKSL